MQHCVDAIILHSNLVLQLLIVIPMVFLSQYRICSTRKACPEAIITAAAKVPQPFPVLHDSFNLSVLLSPCGGNIAAGGLREGRSCCSTPSAVHTRPFAHQNVFSAPSAPAKTVGQSRSVELLSGKSISAAAFSASHLAQKRRSFYMTFQKKEILRFFRKNFCNFLSYFDVILVLYHKWFYDN